MTFDPNAIVLTPTNWLETSVKYEGQCCAEFGQPKGTIQTNGGMCFSSCGEGSVEFQIDPAHALNVPGFDLDPPAPPSGDYRRHGHTNPCVSLTVRTPNGEFIANERIIQESASFGPDRQRICLRPLRGRFETNVPRQAAYWVLPLSNFVLDYWPLPRIYHAELANHPLRVYPTPQIPSGLSEEDQQVATLCANQRNTLITFKVNGHAGFIEPLPTYARSVSRLRRKRIANAITAVMVGQTHVQSVDFADYDNLFPLDLLSFLVHRMAETNVDSANQCSFGIPEFDPGRTNWNSRRKRQQGHAGILDLRQNAIGYLITCAFSSPDCGRKYLRAAINHAISAATKMNTLESRFISVCRGFETLCKYHGLDTKEQLSAGLSPVQKGTVKATLDEAYAKIRAVMKVETDPARRGALERIADRARSAASKENDFGLAVVALARKFGFPDPDILESHYSANPHSASDSWPRILSHYRGASLHGAFFDLPGAHDHFEILQILDHLHDLLLRIIFKTLQYDGPYLPPIPPEVHRSVDWVTAATRANFLLGCY